MTFPSYSTKQSGVLHTVPKTCPAILALGEAGLLKYYAGLNVTEWFLAGSIGPPQC